MGQSKVEKLQGLHDQLSAEYAKGDSLRAQYQQDVDVLTRQVWEISNEITACERQLLLLNNEPNSGIVTSKRANLNQYLRSFKRRLQETQDKLIKRAEKYTIDEGNNMKKIQEIVERLTLVKHRQ